jgi:hypothetical protein
MGRKGVSKRKPGKTKSGPVTIAGNNAGSAKSRITDNLPVEAPERGAAIPSNRGGIKPSSKH